MKSLPRLIASVVVCLCALTSGPAFAQSLTATLTFPAAGAANADLTQPIQWTAVSGAQAYYLYVGTTVGAKDLVNTGETLQTSYLAANLPTGQTLYVRMWTKAGGVWRFVDSTFSAGTSAVLVATLTYPAAGAVNADMSQPIRWTAVPNVQAYYLYVGTTLGAKDLVNTGEILTTSRAAQNLPAGQTLYVRLWTKVGGVWRYADSTFTASVAVAATLTYPPAGAANADMSQPIQWTAIANVQAYYLYVGTTPGAKDLINTGEIHVTSYLAANLPAGLTLYARLWTKVGGVWRSVDSTFTTAPVAIITSPSNGTTGVSPLATIQWNTVTGVQAYVLWIGTSAGASNIVKSPQTLQTSYRPPAALPGGQLLYARMWTEVAGVWRSVDSTFTTAPVATLISPRDGSVSTVSNPVFSWTPVAGIQAYYLYVGTTLGANNVVNTGEIHATSYQSAAVLPAYVPLYVRLWTKWGGAWRSVDSQFAVQPLAFLTNPVDGATNINPNVQFTWSAAAGAQAYYLYVGTTPGAKDVVNTGEVQATSYSSGQLPLGKLLFARMWVKANGAWRFVDSQFTTLGGAEFIWPPTGPSNIDPDATLAWAAVASAQSYRIAVGTFFGGADVCDSGETTNTFYKPPNLPGGVTLYARLWTKVDNAWFYTDVTFSAAAILDDFSSAQIRQTASGEPLWSHVNEGAAGVVAINDGGLQEDVFGSNGEVNSGGAYLQFFPKTFDSYAFPAGYAQSHLERGTWNPQFNRLTFRMKVNRTVPGGSHLFEFGTYIRWGGVDDVGWQGQHFYHFLAPNVYADQWIYVTVNRVPQHQVGMDPNMNWPENPTLDPYFDDLTRFYVDDANQALDGATIVYDDFKFSRVDNEPDALVSNCTAQYTAQHYEASWNSPKWVNQLYEIRYSTTSMKTAGFESGTYGGWLAPDGTAYTTLRWASPDMPRAAGGMFIGIRPIGQTQFTELYVPSSN